MLGLRSGCHHRRRFCARMFDCFGEVSSCSLINQHTMKCQQNGPFIYFPQCTIPTNAITKCHIHTVPQLNLLKSSFRIDVWLQHARNTMERDPNLRFLLLDLAR